MDASALAAPLQALARRLNIPRTTGVATLLLLSGDHWGHWLDAALQHATRNLLLSVYMISPHWRAHRKGDLNLLDTLAAAARRGVQCRAIVGNPNPRYAHAHYNRAASDTLQDAGWRIRTFAGPRVLHEKTLLIDQRLALIGSHNVSRSSATSNYDTSLAIDSPELATLLHRQFWERWRAAAPWPR